MVKKSVIRWLKNKKIRELLIVLVLTLVLPTAAIAGSIISGQITNLQKLKIFVIPSPSPIPSLSPLPLKKVELGAVYYSNGALIGEVKNLGDAKVFNVIIKFMVSKDKSKWDVVQTEYIKIPYVILPGETYKFKEYIKVPQSNPWTTSYIESSEYYTGQRVPTISPSSQNTQQTNNNSGSNVDCIGPDGKQFKTTMIECSRLNESWGKSVDYVVNCGISNNCGGGSKFLSKSVCDTSTCCGFTDGSWVFYTSKDKCTEDQRKGWPSYDYEYLPYSPLPLSSYQPYVGSNYSPQPLPQYNPTTTTVDTSACYSQYNSDIQVAKMYGGNVGSAMTDVAKSNLSRCLASGQVTAVGTIQQDTRPRDRNGKLCSEYGPEVLSYSQSMGCP